MDKVTCFGGLGEGSQTESAQESPRRSRTPEGAPTEASVGTAGGPGPPGGGDRPGGRGEAGLTMGGDGGPEPGP